MAILPGMNGAGAPANKIVTGSFVGTNQNLGSASTYTFTAQSIGAAPAAGERRFICVVAGTGRAGTAATLTMTIGGVTATKIIEGRATGTNWATSTYFFLEVPTGTTANIVLTLSGNTGDRAGIVVYRIITTGDDLVVYNTAVVSSGTNATLSVSVESGGFVIAGGYINGYSTGYTWSGATENSDFTIEGGEHMSTASTAPANDNNAYSITATFSSTQANQKTQAVSFVAR